MTQPIPSDDGWISVSKPPANSHKSAQRPQQRPNRGSERSGPRPPRGPPNHRGSGRPQGVAQHSSPRPPPPPSANQHSPNQTSRSSVRPVRPPASAQAPQPPPKAASDAANPVLSLPPNTPVTETEVAEAPTVAPTPTSPSSPAAPKIPAWAAPKTWVPAVSNTGPVGLSINFSEPSQASTSKHVAKPRKAGKASSKSPHMSLERLLADAHTQFEAPLILPRGLVNKGNFCFANAILQTLVYCTPFYNLFSLVEKQISADFGNTTPLMEAVIQFIHEFKLEDGPIDAMPSEPLLPEYVYDAMRLNKRFDQMRRGHQEDAEEFLGFFLDTLHEELLTAQRKSALKIAQSGSGSLVSKMSEEEKKLNGVSDDDLRRLGVKIPQTGAQIGADLAAAAAAAEILAELDDEIVQRELIRPVSPSDEGWMEVGQKGKTAYTRTTSTSDSAVTRMFGGKLRSVLKTPGAKDSVTLEPYQPLQLDIQPAHVQSIQDALMNMTLPETIPGVWSPGRASQVDATKQVFIESLPPILVLHLKRFIYDEIGGVQKSQKPLAYGTVLEIAPEVLSPPMRAQGKQRYRLFGVVYHHGRFATGGHYTVDVLRQDGLSWLHIDDTLYETIPTEQVVRNAHNLTTKDYGHDGLAYLLFYRRELESDLPAAAPIPLQSASRPVAASTVSSSADVLSTASPVSKARKALNGKPASSPTSPKIPQQADAPPAVASSGPPPKRVVPGWDR